MRSRLDALLIVQLSMTGDSCLLIVLLYLRVYLNSKR